LLSIWFLDTIWLQNMGQLKNSAKSKKKQSPKTEVQNSLKQEVCNCLLHFSNHILCWSFLLWVKYYLNVFMQILQLEKRLQDQFQVRRALESAMGYKTSSHDSTTELSMPKVNSCHNDFMEIEIVYRACHCHSVWVSRSGASPQNL
jgi:hypothetical protein